MGEPFFRIRGFCKNRGVSVFSSNFRLYGDMSRRVMQTLGQLVSEIEIYSIDEAFLDLTGLTDEAVRNITSTVGRWTGIPTALGVGQTKTLAKAANRLAKIGGKTYCDLSDPATCEARLAQLPLADVWGIGRRLVERFERLGCHNGAELAALDPIWVRHNFSIVQEQIIRELRGEACLTVETEPAPRKNIQVSRSFGQVVSDRDTVAQATSTFVAKAAEKMRREHGAAGGICIFLSTGRYRQGPRYEGSTFRRFSTPSFSTHRILQAARPCFDEIWRDGYGYAKAGVILLDIRPFSAIFGQGSSTPSLGNRQRKPRTFAAHGDDR
jgi:DNA polymerase V